jgi:glycosyltransferase involved in cell wall biosynthesis
MNIHLIGQHFFHHAAHSGYDRLASFMGLPLRWDPEKAPAIPRATTPYLNQWYRKGSACQEARVAGLCRSEKPDLVHFLYGDQDYRRAGALVPELETRWVATFHQPASILPVVGIDEAVIRSVTAVVTMGRSQEQFFRARGAREVRTLTHGVDCAHFRPGETPPERFRVLTVGHWLRDFELYFAVAARSAQMKLPLRFVLVARSRGVPRVTLPDNCELRSNISDEELLGEYHAASVLFFPLLDSTANNGLLDGIACGVPYAVSDVGDVRDYVDESGGVLVRGRDELQWISALMTIAGAEETRGRMAAAARALAAQRHDWKLAAARMREFHASVMAMPAGGRLPVPPDPLDRPGSGEAGLPGGR